MGQILNIPVKWQNYEWKDNIKQLPTYTEKFDSTYFK